MTKSTTRVAADLETFTQTEITAKDVVAKAGRKNLIINGGFDVWQRGTSFTTSYFADRFSGNHSGHTTTKSTDVPTGKGFENSAQFVGSGSDPYFFQIVEGSATIAGKEATFSFWIKGGLGQCYIFDGGYTAVESTLIETIGAWTRRSITHAFATGSYNPLIRIGLPINASNTCHTTGWQLELGSFATPFEHRSYGEELALCQRYYQVLVSGDDNYWASGHYYNTGLFALTFSFPSTMRTTPTAGYTTGVNWYLIYTRGGADLIDGITFNRLHPSGGGADVTAATSGVQGSGGTIKTNNPACKIYFDAELY